MYLYSLLPYGLFYYSVISLETQKSKKEKEIFLFLTSLVYNSTYVH